MVVDADGWVRGVWSVGEEWVMDVTCGRGL